MLALPESRCSFQAYKAISAHYLMIRKNCWKMIAPECISSGVCRIDNSLYAAVLF